MIQTLIYQTEDGKTKIETKLQDESMRKIGNSDFLQNLQTSTTFMSSSLWVEEGDL